MSHKSIKLVSSLTIVISIGVLAIKLYAYYATGSVALLSDALESIINVLTSLFALFIIQLAQAPADDDHPYGHGKFQYLSIIFEGGLIALAGSLIFYQAFKALLLGHSLQQVNTGLSWATLSLLLNGSWGLFLFFYGQKHSPVLKASGLHLLTDVISTLGAMLGLVLYQQLSWTWADPIMAILIGLSLSGAGIRLIKQSLDVLLDRANPKLLQLVAQHFNELREAPMIDIHLTKMIETGSFLHLDAHLVTPRFWTIEEAHQWVHDFEDHFFSTLQQKGELHFHLDPCQPHHCSHCKIDNCPVRSTPFIKQVPFTTQSLTSTPSQDT